MVNMRTQIEADYVKCLQVPNQKDLKFILYITSKTRVFNGLTRKFNLNTLPWRCENIPARNSGSYNCYQ